MKVRLQKFLSQAGVVSRRKAEELIAAGKVEVNSEVVTQSGSKVDPETDTVKVNGKKVSSKPYRYVLLNKPKGYVCTKRDRHAEKTIYDLVTDSEGLHNVGRLDKDTEGLILLTNDGELTQKLTHPSLRIPKTYQALVTGNVTGAELQRLRDGVKIDKDGKLTKTSKAEVSVISRGRKTTTLKITIFEGWKRQVRLMCEAVGHPVIELKRTAEGSLTLKNLEVGRFRELTENEVNQLKND